MLLKNLFSNKTFWTYRVVSVFLVTKEKTSLKNQFNNMKASFLLEDGIKNKVKETMRWNEPTIMPNYEFSYIELYGMDNEIYYIFRKQEELNRYIGYCCRCKESISNLPGFRFATPSLFEKYKCSSQEEIDKFFYTDITIEDLKDNLVKADDLSVFIWAESQIMKAILDEDLSELTGCIFSTQMIYHEGKLAQMKKNRIYSEKLSLQNEKDKMISIKETDTETDINGRIGDWTAIVDWLSKNRDVNKFIGEQVVDLFKDCYMRSIKAGKQRIPEMTNQSILQASKQAEMSIEYALKWLPKEYQSIEKTEGGIVLKCPEVSDEKQEIDHIVLSEQGVFLIETKNYSGTIKIDEQGNWVRTKADGKIVGECNPVQQVERHHLLLEHILGITDIYDIICIANDKSIIEGAENSPIPVLKGDMLVHYMKDFENKSGKVYDSKDIEEWKNKINQCRIYASNKG